MKNRMIARNKLKIGTKRLACVQVLSVFEMMDQTHTQAIRTVWCVEKR